MKEFVSLCLKKNPAEVGINCVCFFQFKFCGHICVNHDQIRKEPNPEHDFLLCISNIRLEKDLELSMILTNWAMTQLLKNTEFKPSSRFNLWNWKSETSWRRCLKIVLLCFVNLCLHVKNILCYTSSCELGHCFLKLLNQSRGQVQKSYWSTGS